MSAVNLRLGLGLRGWIALDTNPEMSGATFRLLRRAALSLTLFTLFVLFLLGVTARFHFRPGLHGLQSYCSSHQLYSKHTFPL